MTREEAIKLIDTHTVCFYNEIDSPTLQALHLAIEALSADRPTHERDLISRHEALMELNGACEMWEDDAIVADIIHKLPSIEIVRCKDCKNWRESHSEDEESYCYIDGRTTDSTDYCSWGERADKCE